MKGPAVSHSPKRGLRSAARFGSVWPASLSLLSVPIASGSAFSRRAGWGHTQVWQELRGGGGSHCSWHRFSACPRSAHPHHVQRRGDQFPSLSRVPCCGRFSSCGLCSLWAEVSASLSLPNSLPLVRPSAFSVSRRSLACFRRASSFLLPVRLSGCRQQCRWRACDAQLSQEAGRPGSWQPGFRGADTPGVGSSRRPTGGSPPSKWMGRAACGPSLRKSPALETQQAPALDVNDLRRIWGYNIIVKRRALRTR